VRYANLRWHKDNKGALQFYITLSLEDGSFIDADDDGDIKNLYAIYKQIQQCSIPIHVKDTLDAEAVRDFTPGEKQMILSMYR
jgi:hypothetical protein